jgi:hypothetical protein
MSSQTRLTPRAVEIGILSLTLLLVAVPTHAVKPAKPYQGSCSTVVVPVTPPTTVPQELSITYDCTLAHLGRTTATVRQFVTPTGASPSGVTLSLTNVTTYTAANGDRLIANFSGSALLDPSTGEVAFVGFETFNGGTGRFAGATGSAQLEGTASIFTNTGLFTTKGRISY